MNAARSLLYCVLSTFAVTRLAEASDNNAETELQESVVSSTHLVDSDTSKADTNASTEHNHTKSHDFVNLSSKYVNDKYLAMVHNLDMFLSQRTYEREKNNSHLGFSVANTWFENGDIKNDFRLRAKAHFPGTSERVRLFIETDPDESSALEQRSRPGSTDQTIDNKNSVAGIEYSKEAPLDKWKRSISLGGNLDGGINPLVRYRVRKYWSLRDRWRYGFRQDFWHQGDVGWGETSYFELLHSIDAESWIKVESAIELRDEDKPLEYMNSWRFSRQLSDRWTTSVRLAFFGEGPPQNMVDDRSISTSLVYKLRDYSVFLYLTPEIYFPEEDDYNPEHSITLKFRFTFDDLSY